MNNEETEKMPVIRFASGDEFDDDEEEDEEDEDQVSEEIVVSYACEDCDYRWEVTFENEEEEALDEVQYCPMCGSANTSQI